MFDLVYASKLLMVAIVIDGIDSCPKECRCMHYGNEIIPLVNVQCRGRYLTKVPEDLPKGTHVLELQDNKLNQLPPTFGNIPNLYNLLLQNITLSEIPANIFCGLSYLRYLSLDNNHLTSLDEDVFAGLSRLEALTLSNNDISYIHHSAPS